MVLFRWREDRMIIFELQRGTPFELAKRNDIRVVPVQSLTALRRYWSDWLNRFLPLRQKVKWVLKMIFRRGRLFFTIRNGKCIHYTRCGPARRAIFASVLAADAYGIGPCATDEACRGQGIYPYVVKWVINRLIISYGVRCFYMATRPRNKASIRGIEKAGFRAIGICDYAYRLHPKLFRRVELKPMSCLAEEKV